MDLIDIRESLAEQGWTPQQGKGGGLTVWYPPDGTSKPVSVPTTGKATNRRTLKNIMAGLRRSGWADPQRIAAVPRPKRELALTAPSRTIESGAQVAPESAVMTQDSQLHVEEEDWARYGTGRVSSSIKEQLMSDGTVRYRCAHQRGANCSFVSESLNSVRGHTQAHRMPKLPGERPAKASTGTRRPNDPPTPRQIEARKRTDLGKEAAKRQMGEVIGRARLTGRTVSEPAILPHGLGAGAITPSVLVVAEPTGEVVFECGDPGCDYMNEVFESVFAHRGPAHPRAGRAATASQAATPAVTTAAAAANSSPLPVAMPGTVVGDALTTALLLREAEASVALDRDPSGGTWSLPGTVSTPPAEAEMTAVEHGAQVVVVEEEPELVDVAGDALVPSEPAVPVPVPDVGFEEVAASDGLEPGSSGVTYREAVDFMREQMASIADHLGTMAAAQYDYMAVATARDAEVERLRAQAEGMKAHRDALLIEVEDLKRERKGLIEARDQLAALQRAFKMLGQASD